ncbi:putative metal-dependent hydrolase [Mariniblastus sp.]|nr:putative metal-dependent hydrolase [Mariniblastus sp.]MDA7912006.1 putative metal-dependent hydrolase [bacterium]MDB4461569.1 putative metal-dependent hydrolase [bacterium]MDB4564802.1 putative metal-dependent hydrolase [Mariniblastus sp.]MDC3223763.1 putative metal-dependent hydrolase [Mariniblastus sp.]
MITNNEPPEFPVGEYVESDSPEQLVLQLKELRQCPTEIRNSINSLNSEQLEVRYRNWSIRQIVHHLADSQLNTYIRFKWALTEASPLIKTFNETKWSETFDARESELEPSLVLMDGLHARWSVLIENLSDDELDRTFFHPEVGEILSLRQVLPRTLWHIRHHVGQIAWLRNRHDW